MASKASILRFYAMVPLVCPLLALSASSVNAQESRPALPVDTSLFAAVVQSLSSRVDSIPLAQDRVLRVNPKPLKPNPNVTWITDDDLATVGESIIEARIAALQRVGVDQFNNFPEVPCSDKRGGLPPWNVPPTVSRQRPVALCANIALPRPGGVQYPPDRIDESGDGLAQGRQTSRVVLRNGSMLRVYDVVADPAPGGVGWCIIEWRELFRVQS